MTHIRTSLGKWIAALLAAAACVAQAQAPTSSPAPTATTASASAELRAAAKELFEVMNLRQQMSQMAAAMSQSLPKVMEQSVNPLIEKLPLEKQVEAREIMSESAAAGMKEVMAMMSDPALLDSLDEVYARIYARHFSVAEIKTITAFYRSEAGRKMLERMPALMQESMPEVMGLMAPRQRAMMEKLTKDLSKRIAALQDAKRATQ